MKSPLCRILCLSLALLGWGGRAAPVRAQEARPVAGDAAQSIALEVTRQEMVEARLADLVNRFTELIADLQSNQGVGADVVQVSGGLRQRLEGVKATHLAQAQKLLDEALRRPRYSGAILQAAGRAIELAGRELGSLLLQAGISQAGEVFATELRDIIGRQEALAAAAGRGDGAGLAVEQGELAERVEKLLGELRAMRETPADALALVRLARARKIVEAGNVVAGLRQAAADLAARPAAATERQTAALKPMREAMLKLRPDARLEELVRARNRLKELLQSQQALRTGVAMLAPADFTARQQALVLQQQAIGVPLRLVDPTLEVDAQVAAARTAVAEAASALNAGNFPAAAPAQERVEAALTAAVARLGDQIAHLQALGDAYRRMQEAAERFKLLVELRDREAQVKDGAFEAATTGKPLAPLANAQQMLSREVEAFSNAIEQSSRFARPIRRPLARARKAIEKSAEALAASRFPEAMPEFVKIEKEFKDALEVAKREVGVTEKLWSFQQASQDIKLIRLSIEDVEHEQADLIADVTRAQAEGRTALDYTSPQATLGRALAQIQESVGLIREAAPMRTPLDQAVAAMTTATTALEQDQPAAALAAQQQARAALGEGRKIAASLIKQIDLIVIEIAAASELSANAMDLLQRQIVLRETTEDAPPPDFPRLAGEQDVLLGETEVMAGLSVAPKAADAFKKAAVAMTQAIVHLKAVQRDPAVERQKEAEDALRVAIRALNEYIESLFAAMEAMQLQMEGLQNADILTLVLLLAVEQRELREITQRSPDAVLPGLAPPQNDLRGRADELAKAPNIITGLGRITGYQHIEAASRHMIDAGGRLKAPAKAPAVEKQQLAEKELRIAFAMNVVELVQALMPPLPAEQVPLVMSVPLTDNQLLSADHWAEFAKVAAAADKPVQGGKAEWSSLVDRERAALNENFARELPLEYRKLLKDYYEALAK